MGVSSEFEIGPVRVGSGRLFLIAGPCVIESEAHVRTMADAIQRIAADLGLPYIFKASFDKANRTSVSSFRGPGLKEGTAILRRLAESTGLPVLTDVHEPSQCDIASEGADVLQIPAFLCRQTDLLVAAARTGRAINVKKGQFVAPWDMRHAVEKIASTGNARVFLTERGASFGYNNLVVDMLGMDLMKSMRMGTPKRRFTSARMASPLSRPGPLNDLMDERFALSKDALNTYGMPSFAVSSTKIAATSMTMSSASITFMPPISTNGRSFAKVTPPSSSTLFDKDFCFPVLFSGIARRR